MDFFVALWCNMVRLPPIICPRVYTKWDHLSPERANTPLNHLYYIGFINKLYLYTRFDILLVPFWILYMRFGSGYFLYFMFALWSTKADHVLDHFFLTFLAHSSTLTWSALSLVIIGGKRLSGHFERNSPQSIQIVVFPNVYRGLLAFGALPKNW